LTKVLDTLAAQGTITAAIRNTFKTEFGL